MLLIQVFLVAHAESFLQELKNLIAFETFQFDGLLKSIFNAEENEAVDIKFESVVYESSDAILNLGTLILVIVLSPLFMELVFLFFKLYGCWRRGKAFFEQQH